jgi:hypothetical protein
LAAALSAPSRLFSISIFRSRRIDGHRAARRRKIGAIAGDAVPSGNDWRRWCASVLAVTLVVLGIVAMVNAIVDPFQQYRLASTYTPRFHALHHRWINPGSRSAPPTIRC